MMIFFPRRTFLAATILTGTVLAIAVFPGTAVSAAQASSAVPPSGERSDSYVQQARDIAIEQPGPHEGSGTTTAYPFFEDAKGFDIVFRQRALHPGASIGEHRNDKDEIYYVLSGRGELLLDGRRREVAAGDAVLTRDGSTHALFQRGDQALVIIVVYRKRPQP
jgi:quercetin dioxygenase-like cupin family protein